MVIVVADVERHGDVVQRVGGTLGQAHGVGVAVVAHQSQRATAAMHWITLHVHPPAVVTGGVQCGTPCRLASCGHPFETYTPRQVLRFAEGTYALLLEAGGHRGVAAEIEVVGGVVVEHDVVGYHVDILHGSGARREVGRAILHIEARLACLVLYLRDVVSNKTYGCGFGERTGLYTQIVDIENG